MLRCSALDKRTLNSVRKSLPRLGLVTRTAKAADCCTLKAPKKISTAPSVVNYQPLSLSLALRTISFLNINKHHHHKIVASCGGGGGGVLHSAETVLA